MQHVTHRVPVTALAFLGEQFLLSGEGTYLKLYDATTRKLLKRISLFEDQAIHGIIVQEEVNLVLVWGGEFIRPLIVVRHEYGELGLRPGDGWYNVGDWILDASFAPSPGVNYGCLVGLVTAHNALSTAKIEILNTTCTVRIDHPIQGSNSLLYSAHIIWLSESRCLVASGTAFGDIVVWSATFSLAIGEKATAVSIQTHYTFCAHEGSVFGVRLSPSIMLPGVGDAVENKRILASCSDDRTVRLWDISDLTTQSQTLMEIQQETGFGGEREKQNGNAPRCLARAMGHVSRIWQVRFVLHESSDVPISKILSFGEDASVIVWSPKVNTTSSAKAGLVYSLEQDHISTAHAGKNIWSIAMNGRLLATGGAEGAIAIYADYSTPGNAVELFCSLLDFEGGGLDTFRAYGFLDDDLLFSTTNHGRLILVDLNPLHGNEMCQEISPPITGLRGYSIVTTVPGIAFVGGTDGIVYAYTQNKKQLCEVVNVTGKVAGLFAYQYAQNNTALFVTSVSSTTAQLVFFKMDESKASSNKCLQMTLCQGFITTSFACQRNTNDDLIVLGSRSGSIYIYCLPSDYLLEPIQCPIVCKDIHGKEAVTSVAWRDDYILSTARDGTFAMHQMRRTQDGAFQMDLVHQLPLPFGPNIEGLNLSTEDSLLVWGFRSRHFVVYDIQSQREVMTVECGGAHRNWSYQSRLGGGRFVWTKASRLFVTTQNALAYQLVNSGNHGREIKAIAISPSCSAAQIIATGAEDTDIKLFKLEYGSFKCLQTLRKHNTGIQCLMWSSDGAYLFSSGGFEEFMVWTVRSNVPYIGIGAVNESKHPRSGSSDLRIMGFDAQEHGASTDPEVHNQHTKEFRITMAYSDSTLKIWKYCDKKWELTSSAKYLTACLTDAIYLGNHDFDFLTTATDGNAAIWNPDQCNTDLSWVERNEIHQSAIHVAKLQHLEDGFTLLVTGADDNAIGITRLGKQGIRDSYRTLLIPRAHAAAVTGVVLFPISDRSTTRAFGMVSASIDQRVKAWHLEIDCTQGGVEGITVKPVQNYFTAVADVSSLELCQLESGEMGFLVAGVGMEVLRLPPDVDTG